MMFGSSRRRFRRVSRHYFLGVEKHGSKGKCSAIPSLPKVTRVQLSRVWFFFSTGENLQPRPDHAFSYFKLRPGAETVRKQARFFSGEPLVPKPLIIYSGAIFGIYRMNF